MKLRSVFVGSVSMLALASMATPAMADEQLETVVVTGIRASMQRAMDIKRDATTIVDAVSAEDIGKFPDKNVADALQRVPGVNTVSAASGEGGFDENDRVSIRGTNASLTQTLINGHAVSTGDWFILDQYQTIGRSVSYSLFPAEIVSSVKVYKSQQADLVEGGVAGSVDIVTRKPLDFKDNFTLEASGEAAYTTLRGDTTPQLNALAAWQNDSHTFGVMVQGFYEARNIRRDGQEFLGYASCGDSSKTTPADRTAGCPTAAAHPEVVGTLYPTLIGSALFLQERIRQGGDVAVQFRPSEAIEINVDAFYSHMGASNQNNNFMFWGSNEFANNAASSYTIKDGVFVSATFPAKTGATPIVADFIMRPHSMSDSYYFNGDVTYNPTASTTIKVKAGYTRGAGTTPQQAAWEGTVGGGSAGVSYDFTNGGGASVAVTGANTSVASSLTNDWAWGAVSKASDHEVYAQADIEQEMKLGPIQSVKAGFRYTDHRHKSDIWDGGVSYGSNPGLTGDTVSSSNYPSDFGEAFGITLTNVPMGDMSKIVSVLNTQKSWRSYTQSSSDVVRGSRYMWSGATDVHESDTAGYAMAVIGGDRWKGNFGVRIVNTSETIIQPVNGTAAVGGVCPTSGDIYSDFGCFHWNTIDKEYWNVLPSANLSFNLTDDSMLRFAAAETMARPDYSALGGAVNLTDLTHVGSGGNSNLKPIRSANYNLTYELYYGPQAMISVGVFYMDLASYVTYGTTKGNYLDMLKTGQGTPVYSSYDITAPYNTSGHDEGIEIQWQQPIWNGLGVIANYTYANGAELGADSVVGHRELVGDSKNTANLSVYYENNWVSARVSYSYASQMLVGLDRSTEEHQNAYDRIDASVNFTVTDNLTLTFNGLNLTNRTLRYYANDSTMPRALYSNGSQLYAGVRFKY